MDCFTPFLFPPPVPFCPIVIVFIYGLNSSDISSCFHIYDTFSKFIWHPLLLHFILNSQSFSFLNNLPFFFLPLALFFVDVCRVLLMYCFCLYPFLPASLPQPPHSSSSVIPFPTLLSSASSSFPPSLSLFLLVLYSFLLSVVSTQTRYTWHSLSFRWPKQVTCLNLTQGGSPGKCCKSHNKDHK